MKISSSKRATIVGIFIFIGLVIFVLTVLTLGSQKKTFQKSIMVKAFFDDVNGLQKGNNVWFSGVKIGTIKQVTLSNAKVEVLINVEEKSKQFIRKDAKAKVSSDGLIGNKIIVIYGGTLQAPEIEKDDVLGVEKFKTNEEMLNTLQKSNDNLLDITTGFRTISNGIVAGKGTIGKLLTDEALVNTLNATTASLKRASLNIENLSSTMSSYAARLHTKGSLADELVSDTMVFSELRSTVMQFKSASQTADSLINTLKQSGENLNESLNNKNSPVGLLLHDEQAASNIKTTLKNLQTSSQKLDEDLEAVQHNFLLRRFFKKKAKNTATPDTLIIENKPAE